MSTQEAPHRTKNRLELLQGTLDLLILRTFSARSTARASPAPSNGLPTKSSSWSTAVFTPRSNAFEDRGWISAKRGTSSNNRKGRFYSLTVGGRKQLGKETTQWKRLTEAIGRILESERG